MAWLEPVTPTLGLEDRGGVSEACRSMALTLVSPLGFFPGLHNVKATEPVKRMSAEHTGLTNDNSLKEQGYQ